MQIDFIDPRSNPEPPARTSREPVAHGEELRELLDLCTAARTYDVERWIQARKPIQALTYKRRGKTPIVSPLRAAIRRKHADLVLLLLCNGYRLDIEVEDGGSVLDEALKIRAFEILEQLLRWGADPTKVSAEEVIDTYSTDLIERFWQAGADYTADPAFISYLAHTVNKPLYGWLRQHRSDARLQDALDVALLEAVMEDKELPARLLLWAGANPHRKVPMERELDQPGAWDEDHLFSSAEAAISFGRYDMLDHLRVASMPDLESQAASAHDPRILRTLVGLRQPSDWSEIILAVIRRFCSRHGSGSSWEARDALKYIESNGGRLVTVSPDAMRHLRSELLEVREPDEFKWLMRWLKKANNCEPVVFAELTRTSAIRGKIEAVNTGARYISPHQKMSLANSRRQKAAEAQKARDLGEEL